MENHKPAVSPPIYKYLTSIKLQGFRAEIFANCYFCLLIFLKSNKITKATLSGLFVYIFFLAKSMRRSLTSKIKKFYHLMHGLDLDSCISPC